MTREDWVPFTSFRLPVSGSDIDDFVDARNTAAQTVAQRADTLPVDAYSHPPRYVPFGQASANELAQPNEQRAQPTGGEGGELAEESAVPTVSRHDGDLYATPFSTAVRKTPFGDPADDPALVTPGNEGTQAARNAASLGTSLLFTTAIGFVVQFASATMLGPETHGRVGTAEVFAGLLLGLFSFGFDNYVRKEVSVRPSHARQFVPGVLAFRLAVFIPASILIAVVMTSFGKPGEVVAMFALFAAVRYLLQTNEMLTACLHAIGQVAGLPRQNLMAKVVSAIAIIGGITVGLRGFAVPIGLLLGELVKTSQLIPNVGRRLQVWSEMSKQQVRPVLAVSLPFLSVVLMISFAMFLDVTLLSFLVPDEEVGFYRFSQQMTQIIYVPGTVLPWVVMPMAARAALKSRRELSRVMCRVIELVLTLSIPLSVLLFLHADTVLGFVADIFGNNGARYRFSVGSLRLLALSVVGTYLSMILNTMLQSENRMWVGIRVGLVVAVTDGVLVVMFAKMGLRSWGAGGAATATALALVVAETIGTLLLLRAVGPRVWDARGLRTARNVLLAMVPVVLADIALRRLGNNYVRAVGDVLVLGANFALLRLVDLGEIKRLLGRGGSGDLKLD